MGLALLSVSTDIRWDLESLGAESSSHTGYQLKKGRKRGGSRVKAVAHKKRASAALGRDDDEDDCELKC